MHQKDIARLSDEENMAMANEMHVLSGRGQGVADFCTRQGN
jgi:hypothetical protein